MEQDALSPDFEASLLCVYSYLGTFITLLISTLFPLLFSPVQAQQLASHSFDRLASSNLRFPVQSGALLRVYRLYTLHSLKPCFSPIYFLALGSSNSALLPTH